MSGLVPGDGRMGWVPAPEAASHVTGSRFLVPELPHDYVPRDRLDDWFDAERSITLVSAPAGWGKTVAAAAWARGQNAQTRIIWVRFEPGDASRARSLVAHAFLRSETARRRNPTERAVLVLDNFHEVADQATSDNIELLVRESRGRLRLVVLCRDGAAPSLYRLRLGYRLTEIRAAHLAFTGTEIGEFLRSHEVGVPGSVLRRLQALTEGWPAGVRLAVRAMTGRPDADRAVEELGIDGGALVSYLEQEVLGPLGAEEREFLFRISILERVCADLARAVTGRLDADRILARLAGSGIAVHCGGRREWYRLRPLPHRMSHARLGELMADRVPALHRRAAAWYAVNGMPTQANRHALAGGDYTAAAELADRDWPAMLRGGSPGGSMVPDAALPQSTEAEPALSLALALCRHDAGDAPGMAGCLAAARRGLPAGDPRATILAASELAYAELAGDPFRLRAAALSLLGGESRRDTGVDEVRPVALLALAKSSLALGEYGEAATFVAEAMETSRRRGLSAEDPALTLLRSLTDLGAGRLAAAVRSAELVLAMDADRCLCHSRQVWLARLVLCAACIERGQVEQARYHLDEASASTDRADPTGLAFETAVAARLAVVTGEAGAGLAAMSATRRELGEARLTPAGQAYWSLVEAETLCASGDFAAARSRTRDPDALRVFPAWAAAVAARTYLIESQPDPAARVLEPHVHAAAEPAPHATEAALLYAKACSDLGHQVESERFLELALELADDEAIVRPFAVDPGLVKDLLMAHLSGATRYRELVSMLLGHGGKEGRRNGADSSVADALTERELTVLRCLQSLMSTAEIAGALRVSVNTVKTHVKSIYRKLAVDRRRDAVRRAREADLL